MTLNRRNFLKIAGGAALGAGVLVGCAGKGDAGKKARVVVVGGGYGGAAAAKYLRLWEPLLEVVLIERNASFISCPQSNLVLGGSRSLSDLTIGYGDLADKHGVTVVRNEVVGVDPAKRVVTLKDGSLTYDRLILSPGVELSYQEIPSLSSPAAQEKVLHAWKAGPQTLALRKQLEAMPDGGTFVLTIPKAPYRCPPGPYERVCQVAFYFKNHKPKSKIIVLDANADIVSKKGLFTKAWQELYPGLIEYRPNNALIGVDPDALTVETDFEKIKAAVLNVVPPQRAGEIAELAGVTTLERRWCEVDLLTYESLTQKNIHVIGDAIAAPPGVPKSGHIANQTAKVCAAAVIALLKGQPVNPAPLFANTCYSWVDDKRAVNVAGVYRYDPAKKTMVGVEGASGVSDKPSELEGGYAQAWAINIWSDMLM